MNTKYCIELSFNLSFTVRAAECHIFNKDHLRKVHHCKTLERINSLDTVFTLFHNVFGVSVVQSLGAFMQPVVLPKLMYIN